MSSLTYLMTPAFSVGDTADCYFGRRVTWRDSHHLESRRYDGDENPEVYRINSVTRTDNELKIECEWPARAELFPVIAPGGVIVGHVTDESPAA